VDLPDALAVLGVTPGATVHEVRAAYRRLVREVHPDVATDASDVGRRTARLADAYDRVRAAIAATGGDRVPAPPAAAPTPPPGPPPPPSEGLRLEATALEADAILVGAPAGETFAALFEAAGRVGPVAYFDRHLGIIETIVRFEGGPSCSVLITLQGRAMGTEAFVTMESIEADPAPPVAPVVEALVAELRTG
jgi:hypothetical protein